MRVNWWSNPLAVKLVLCSHIILKWNIITVPLKSTSFNNSKEISKVSMVVCSQPLQPKINLGLHLWQSFFILSTINLFISASPKRKAPLPLSIWHFFSLYCMLVWSLYVEKTLWLFFPTHFSIAWSCFYISSIFKQTFNLNDCL